MMHPGLLLVLILSYLDLSQSTCPVFCDTTSITFECHVTANTPELEDNWIQSCHYPSSGIQFLRIFVTNYSYPSISINLPSNRTSLRNIIITFYQTQSLTLNSNSDNSNVTSLTLSGGNSFTNGITDFLSKFPNLVSLYMMNNTQLEYLEDESFVSLTELEQLTVERVGIERIGENLFVGLSVLLRLEWTSSITSNLASSAFSHLPSLQYLNLMDNKIDYIPDNLFKRHLTNLKCITLVRNELTTIPYQAFEQCPSLSSLRLEHNPLICNCSLYWMHFAIQRGFIANITISCANYQVISNLTTPHNSATTVLNISEIVTSCNDTDMYECLSPTQPCEYLCTNSLTGFSCSCDDGYILESDGYTCGSNISQCPADHSYCPDSSCCIPSLYSCPLNLTDTLEGEMGVTVLQVSPLQEVVNRSILLSSVDDTIALNLSLSVSSQVLVQSCEVDWQQCFVTVLSLTMTESFTVQFSLPSTGTSSGSPLHYLLLSVTEMEGRAVQLYERLLVVIQNSLTPTLYTRSLVRTAVSATSSDVLIGAAVSSLEASLCSQVCPDVSVSLFSVGLVDVDISDWEGVSVRLVGCTFLPSQYWMSYNSYVFSIEWDDVSSELNGKYELRMNVSGLSSGVSELSIDYPVAEDVCEGRLDMGVYWNWTRNGTSSVIPCSQLFGPLTDDVQFSDQFMERSCDSNLQWSDITIECAFSGDISQILSFTAILIPSQLTFVPLYYPDMSLKYTDLCISYTSSILLGFGVPLLSTQQSNSIITFWFDASGVNIEQINSFLSTELSTDLSACLTEYSFHFLTQSTICDCVTSPDATVELQHTRLCTTPACSCTNTSCSCNKAVYGDGTNCSLDTDGDGLPDNEVVCGSSLCVDTCPYQSRCVSPAAEVSEGCEVVCPHETDSLFSLTWPCTAGGASREVTCPTGGRVAVRKCRRDGTWEDPSTLDCVSDSYANLGLNINNLLITVLGTPPVVFGDLVVSLNILEENSRNLQTESTQYARSVLNTASQVMSILVTDSSINLLRALEKEVPIAERLLDSLDRFVDNLAVRNCSAVRLQYDRVSFQVIKVSDLSNQLSISTDNIGENGMSPSVDILQSIEVECITYAVIENLASVVADTSSLRFGSIGLDGSVFEEILISPTLQSVNLYKDDQTVIEKGGNPLIRLHFHISTANIDLESHRVEVAVGYLTSQSGIARWEGDGVGVVHGRVTSTVSVEVIHLTSFAAILGITAISPTSSVLPLITYIGSTIAIICLGLSLILYVILGRVLLKKIYHFIHFNILLSLLLSYVVFMLGIELAYANFLQFIPCKIVSYTFTYLLLVTFLWMLMETIVILIMARWPYYHINIKYYILFFCVSWIGPLVYTLVTLSWFHTYFISPPFDPNIPLTQPVSGTCWIDTSSSTTNITISILAIPTIIIKISILSLAIAVCVILRFANRDEPELPRSTKASIRLLITISILYPLIVTGWLFGLLALSLKINILFWFFALFASAQGVVCLILVTIRSSIYNSMLKLVRRVSKWLHLQPTSGEELDYDAPFSDEPTTTNLSIQQDSPSQSRPSSIRSHSPPRPLSLQQEMTILKKPIQKLDDLKRFLEERSFDRPGNRLVEEQTYFDNLTTRI